MPYPDNLLVTGERIYVRKRPHWKVLILPTIFFILIIGGCAALITIVNGRGWNWPSWAYWVIVAIAAIALIILVIVPFIRWRTEHFVISNHHIFFRTGLLSRREHQIPLGQIANIETDVTFWGRLMGYGSLIVESSADQPLKFRNVASLSKIQAMLNQLIRSEKELTHRPDLPVDDFAADDADHARRGQEPPQPTAGTTTGQWTPPPDAARTGQQAAYGQPTYGQPAYGQGYPAQGYPPQQPGYPPQGQPGHPQQGYPPPGYPQPNPQQGYQAGPTEGYRQGYPQQAGYPGTGSYPTQGAPGGYPQGGYPGGAQPGYPQPGQAPGYPQQGSGQQGSAPQQGSGSPQWGTPPSAPAGQAEPAGPAASPPSSAEPTVLTRLTRAPSPSAEPPEPVEPPEPAGQAEPASPAASPRGRHAQPTESTPLPNFARPDPTVATRPPSAGRSPVDDAQNGDGSAPRT